MGSGLFGIGGSDSTSNASQDQLSGGVTQSPALKGNKNTNIISGDGVYIGAKAQLAPNYTVKGNGSLTITTDGPVTQAAIKSLSDALTTATSNRDVIVSAPAGGGTVTTQPLSGAASDSAVANSFADFFQSTVVRVSLAVLGLAALWLYFKRGGKKA